jgi:ribosomal protein S18 acetylase RimI-like enzyme
MPLREDRDDADPASDSSVESDADGENAGAGGDGPSNGSLPPVRPARLDDAAAVRTLQSLLPAPSPTLLTTAIGSLDPQPDPVVTAGPTALTVSPTADGRPAGYLLALCGPDETHVAELVVAPDYRRQGRATALVADLRSRLRAGEREGPTTNHDGVGDGDGDGDPHRLTLLVAPSNGPAVSLYRSLGFDVETRLPDHFGGDPALRMTHRL